MDQTPQSSTLHRLRNVLEMSNRTTPAESQSKQSETEWKTPNKGGYPEHSPRSNAMKWLKSEEAFLTFSTISNDFRDFASEMSRGIAIDFGVHFAVDFTVDLAIHLP